MNIKYEDLPFDHIVIEDLFNENEYDVVNISFDYMDSIMETSKVSTNIDTAATAKDLSGNLLAKRDGFFLNNIFSDTFSYFYPAVVIKQILKKNIESRNFFSFCVSKLEINGVLYSNYKNNDYYKPHSDASIVTGIFYNNNYQINYDGGDLVFKDYNFIYKPKHNSMIFFPSILLHEVTTIKQKDNSVKHNNKNLRSSLVFFLV